MLSGFVVTDGASDHRTEDAVMSRIVACDAADESSLNAASGISGICHRNRGKSQSGANEKVSHWDTHCHLAVSIRTY
jgi:hypothetical protein